MTILSFTTTGAWDSANSFGCASLGLAGQCGNDEKRVISREYPAQAVAIAGTYGELLTGVREIVRKQPIYAGIVLFGNAGGENVFLRELTEMIDCPMVGGGAAIDGVTGRKGLIPGGKDAALLLFTDDRYSYETETRCIHDEILDICDITMEDPRTLLTINGVDAVEYLARKRTELGLSQQDFEHLTLSDMEDVNAHLSYSDGKIKSGRDLCPRMKLRYVAQEKVYPTIRAFYDDDDAIVFGCAGLAGLLERPLDTGSLGLFLFGEVCTVNGKAEFGNLMLSKLKIYPK